MATFGNTVLSGNWNGGVGANVMYASKAYSPATDGVITSISAYIRKSVAGTTDCAMALYRDVGGGITTAVLVTSSIEVIIPNVAAWYTFAVTPANIFSTESYYFVINEQSASIDIDYAVSGVAYSRVIVFGAFPDPFGALNSTDINFDVAYYGTYTPRSIVNFNLVYSSE